MGFGGRGPAMQAGHVGVNVTDLARSKAFYQAAFGFELLGESSGGGRRFVLLGEGERVALTLWEQSGGRFDPARPGLHHLAFQVPTLDDVRAAEERLRALGARFQYDGIVPHGEGAASGGIFFEDPDGVRLEIFTARAEAAHATDGPACGFF
jgi:lactoylglutathione lyase